MKIPSLQEIQSAIFTHPVVMTLIDWMKRTSLPGFLSVPIYDVLQFTFQEAQKESIMMRANSMAFSFMLSLFPFMIVLLTLLPYLPIDNYIELLNEYLSGIVPTDVKSQVMDSIGYVLKPRSGLLSFSFLLAFFFASNGVMALMRGFDKDYDISFLTRNALQKRWVALKLTFILGSLFLLSIGLVMIGHLLIDLIVTKIKADSFTKFSFNLLRWFVVLFLFYTGIAFIYRYGPALKRKFNFFSPGATLATTLSLLSSLIFSYFINRFKNNIYDDIYGSSFATLIAFMIWLQINAYILIIGFELNTSISINKARRKLEQNIQVEKE